MTDERLTVDHEEQLVGDDASEFDPDDFEFCGSFTEFNTETVYTYRARSVLEYLCLDRGLSQMEVAEHFGLTQPAISYWVKKHDIPSGRGHGTFGLNPTGGTEYGRYRVCVGGDVHSVYVHQLLAVANGADPQHVFGNGHSVHHELPTKVALNVAANLDMVTYSEHREIAHPRHVDGSHWGADTASTLEEIGFERSGVPLEAIEGLHGSRLKLETDDDDTEE